MNCFFVPGHEGVRRVTLSMTADQVLEGVRRLLLLQEGEFRHQVSGGCSFLFALLAELASTAAIEPGSVGACRSSKLEPQWTSRV